MSQQASLPQDIRAFIIDMDGVLYEGNRTILGAVEFMDMLHQENIPFLLLTNNATRTPTQFVDRLAGMNIQAREEDILTSALATAKVLARRQAGARVLPVGETGLLEALRQEGFRIVEEADASPDFVVAALDTQLTYTKLREATWAVRRGAKLIATNSDKTLPTEQGEAPGAGAIVGALEIATGAKAEVIGKPQGGIFQQALDLLGTTARQSAAIGDRLETDILGAKRVDILTILVLTGITTPDILQQSSIKPDMVLPDLTHLVDLLRNREAPAHSA